MTQWLSINDVRRLVKRGMYRLETGSKPGDSLIWDNRSKQYVGHIENGGSYFRQDSSYIVPVYVIQALETYDGNDWLGKGFSW